MVINTKKQRENIILGVDRTCNDYVTEANFEIVSLMSLLQCDRGDVQHCLRDTPLP